MSNVHRNSERSNAANYCSCWTKELQNHSGSCQLQALTTVMTQEAEATGKFSAVLSPLLYQFPRDLIILETAEEIQISKLFLLMFS